MDRNHIMEIGGFYFIHNFDSGNLGHVERVPTDLIAPCINLKTNASETPDYEFNMWTRPDCAGTEFENGNRTWFYFGMQASEPNALVRLNLINLNKQGKMYNQGMAPVTRTLPGKPQWERIRDRPVHSTDENSFTLSFKYRTSENLKATTFFAFTYPFSFAELQIALNTIDSKLLPLQSPTHEDDIYYCRECLIHSLEGRRVDLLTITSYHGITTEREERLKNLFPEKQERPFKFVNKKVIFISARVHPGETPSSFVFNGFLNLLLSKNDPIAAQLRKNFVFKMIPFLNPDGVARGHYRTDTRGVNLNRVYLNPSLELHPTVYAARALIRYYHFGCEKEDNGDDVIPPRSISSISESVEQLDTKKPVKSGHNSRGNSSSLKNRELRKGNKSSTTVKPTLPSASKKGISEAANLADQVLEMKIQEMQSQTSDATGSSKHSTPLLTDSTLQTCLGSTVHISTSEELNLQGVNPLRPLRDTLKNSLSLLMDSSSTLIGSGSGSESRNWTVKVGWCGACRRSVGRLERSMPGITGLVPGYSASLIRSESPSKYDSIDEYRQHQRQKFDQQMHQQDAAGMPGEEYFCTNCFKRYTLNDEDEDSIRLPQAPSTASVAVSAGDSGDVRDTPPAAPPAGSTGDATISPPSPPKQEKPKSVKTSIKKKALLSQNIAESKAAKVPTLKEVDSGLYLYVDLHGHASKKGIFMYGNYFPDVESSVECMLLPRIMSLNSLHFHFSSCNFTERNMYLRDRRDGMSREGSGRVAVLKATGLVRSYTLECNYNTGRLVNVLPPPARDSRTAHPPAATPPAPPKYTPHIFEEVKSFRGKYLEVFEDMDPMKVGRSLGASILDLTGQHPNSRVPASEHRSVAAVREWLRAHTRTIKPQLTMSRLRPKIASPTRAPLYVRSKAKVTDERKENTFVGAKFDTERRKSPPVLAPRSGHDIINVNMKVTKKPEAVKTTSRTRYLAETESKTKSLTSKRRSILAIRKPNASKPAVGGIVKTKVSRRSADDTEASRTSKLGKRSFSWGIRSMTRAESRPGCRGAASSSSEDMGGGGWEEVAGGTALAAEAGAAGGAGGKRRPFPTASPARLKKIRLKTVL